MAKTTWSIVAMLFLSACGGTGQVTRRSRGLNDENITSEAARAYRAQCRDEVERARDALRALERPRETVTVDNLLEPLNALVMVIDRTAGLADLYRSAHPDQQLARAAEECEQEIKKVATELNMSRPLFEAVSALDVSGQDADTRRWVEHLLRDFRRAGVDKDAATRDEIKKLQEELVRIGQEFNRNILKDVRSIELDSPAELEGLPPDYVEAHEPGEDGKIKITTDYPDYIPFMTYARNDAARLALYQEFRNRGWPANDQVLATMLRKRHELAKLLGYPDWADYVTEDKMIKTAHAAAAFIDKVARLATPRAEEDYQELLERMKKEIPDATEVGDWQKSWVEELVKRDAYSFDSQATRPYFAYRRVEQGVLDITSRLFGLTYRKSDADVWHPQVESYEILDGGEVIGRFFLDMHPRENKYKHAAAFPIQAGVAGKRLPVAALVCNFPGGGDEPGYMEHHQVVTFFHEFGHLLHHLLAGRQRWVEQSGIATEWDFVEAPSQLLEEWAWQPDVLRIFARNDKGETIPDELIDKMLRARNFGKGLFVKHQMFYAALSLGLYDRSPEGLDPTAFMKELQSRYSPFGYVPDTHMQASFGHLFGYSAMYYTYMWSLVIARDLLSRFEQEGMLSEQTAAAYRRAVLEPGGSKDAAELVRDFLGRDYGFEAFADWVNER